MATNPFRTRRFPRQQPPPSGPPLLLSTAIANAVLGVCEAFLNLRVFLIRPDGTNEEAEVKMTDMGCTVTIPLTGTGSGSSESWPPVLFDSGASYSAGKWVWLKTSHALVTAGTASPGLWRSLRATSPSHQPTNTWATSDDPTAADNYWLYFGGGEGLLCV